jgi:polyketide-type polyunsaturated fatty acid synthase PfaA
MDCKDVIMGTQKKKNPTPQEQTPSTTPIAIVGMAGIFPEAPNLERYWENIMAELNCVSEVPESRWRIADYYDADPSKPDKSYSKYGGFIPDIEFDPMEFGLPPNFLEVTDVSQLLGLIVARDALADAGITDKNNELLDRTGVVLGMVGMSSKVIQPLLNRLQYPLWEKVLKTSSVPDAEIPEIIEKMKSAYISWNENAFPGAIGNVVAGRIANRLDLGGTNCVVDAACGSSLAAVNLAVSELALGHADMMITGGVDTDNSILTFMCFSKTPAFSKGDHLRAFSADSDGMLSGEGIGMLVMKRLADAERDNDRIYAVVRGIGTSSDGNFKSIYAPRPSGQAKALKRAYERAGYEAGTVGLVEAHGTGTMAGDPAEFEGMRDIFAQNNPDKQHIALGSVKSQIGHTKAAAGAASMIKATLALYHKVLPATINVSKPNPAMEIESTPFYLNTETRPWFSRADGAPRRAFLWLRWDQFPHRDGRIPGRGEGFHAPPGSAFQRAAVRRNPAGTGAGLPGNPRPAAGRGRRPCPQPTGSGQLFETHPERARAPGLPGGEHAGCQRAAE